MIYFLISILSLSIVISFLGKYLEIKCPGSKKAELTMNFLYTILFIVILIPCGVISVLSMNPYLIAITFGVNIALGAWLGIFLKKLQETLE